MRVPKYIRDKMHRVVELEIKASELMLEIDEWLLRNGIPEEWLTNGGELRCGDGASLEELEYGIDVVDLIAEKLAAFSPDCDEEVAG